MKIILIAIVILELISLASGIYELRRAPIMSDEDSENPAEEDEEDDSMKIL